ncbi:hypothetical protein [Desulfotomaculum sp. 1211_IL3151]|uniref:hypothetical protein n=1 Tax=Desulfotomaculum sp. 1211_IL3151 TaxID=3084055 RepID=UPI002FD94D0F
MRKTFKTLILSLTLLFMFSSFAFASSDEVVVQEKGHGEYKLSSEGEKALKIKKHKGEDIFEITDKDSLQNDKEYNKLLRVNEDTFLRVKEVRVNLLDSTEVEDTIAQYDINQCMASDIKAMSEKAQEPDSESPKELKIYTPKKPIDENSGVEATASWSKSSSYYYVGYNNYKYLDEIFYAENRTPFQSVKSGTSTKTYITGTIKNIGQYILNGTIARIYGTEYVVAKLFFPNISDFSSYPANTADFWQASLIEDKYKKYTSIEVYDMGRYVYSVKAIGSRANVNFNHYVYYKALMSSPSYKQDPSKPYYSPNYNSLDKKAYAYMNDSIPYDESFDYWTPNDYTRFTSIN